MATFQVLRNNFMGRIIINMVCGEDVQWNVLTRTGIQKSTVFLNDNKISDAVVRKALMYI